MTISWARHDSVRDLTIITVLAFVIAGALAEFGLPPVSLHGPQHFVGIMDPLCGMTRAVRFLALGRVGRAVEYNPASPLLAVFGVVMLARGVVGGITGRWLSVRVRRSNAVLAVSVLLVGALWINQQVHASLLMRS